jgi:hypothetical protein
MSVAVLWVVNGSLPSTVSLLLNVTIDPNARMPLSFRAVSFGQDSSTSYTLRRMAQIALEAQKKTQIYLEAQITARTVPFDLPRGPFHRLILRLSKR